jgi:CSLREA domain-containing protein
MTRQTFSSRGITKPRLGFLVWVGVAMALVMAMPGRAMAAEIVVTSAADPTGTVSTCSLRDAVTAADDNGGAEDCEARGKFGADRIVFDAGGPATITLLSLLDITDDERLTIDGAIFITISGDDAFRVFVNVGASLTLDSLTVHNGRVVASNGGGIENTGTLAVIHSMLTGKSATASFGGGGGVWNSGTLTITESRLVQYGLQLEDPRRGYLHL